MLLHSTELNPTKQTQFIPRNLSPYNRAIIALDEEKLKNFNKTKKQRPDKYSLRLAVQTGVRYIIDIVDSANPPITRTYLTTFKDIGRLYGYVRQGNKIDKRLIAALRDELTLAAWQFLMENNYYQPCRADINAAFEYDSQLALYFIENNIHPDKLHEKDAINVIVEHRPEKYKSMLTCHIKTQADRDYLLSAAISQVKTYSKKPYEIINYAIEMGGKISTDQLNQLVVDRKLNIADILIECGAVKPNLKTLDYARRHIVSQTFNSAFLNRFILKLLSHDNVKISDEYLQKAGKHYGYSHRGSVIEHAFNIIAIITKDSIHNNNAQSLLVRDLLWDINSKNKHINKIFDALIIKLFQCMYIQPYVLAEAAAYHQENGGTIDIREISIMCKCMVLSQEQSPYNTKGILALLKIMRDSLWHTNTACTSELVRLWKQFRDYNRSNFIKNHPTYKSTDQLIRNKSQYIYSVAIQCLALCHQNNNSHISKIPLELLSRILFELNPRRRLRRRGQYEILRRKADQEATKMIFEKYDAAIEKYQRHQSLWITRLLAICHNDQNSIFSRLPFELIINMSSNLYPGTYTDSELTQVANDVYQSKFWQKKIAEINIANQALDPKNLNKTENLLYETTKNIKHALEQLKNKLQIAKQENTTILSNLLSVGTFRNSTRQDKLQHRQYNRSSKRLEETINRIEAMFSSISLYPGWEFEAYLSLTAVIKKEIGKLDISLDDTPLDKSTSLTLAAFREIESNINEQSWQQMHEEFEIFKDKIDSRPNIYGKQYDSIEQLDKHEKGKEKVRPAK